MSPPLRALPYLVAFALVATIDADRRGPLAGPADVWIAGHVAEAERRFDALPSDAVRGLTLPSPSDRPGPVNANADAAAEIDRFLLDSLRDDDARLLYAAAWRFRHGDPAGAIERLRALEVRRPTDAVRRLLLAWDER